MQYWPLVVLLRKSAAGICEDFRDVLKLCSALSRERRGEVGADCEEKSKTKATKAWKKDAKAQTSRVSAQNANANNPIPAFRFPITYTPHLPCE